jgi:hypothetical protein
MPDTKTEQPVKTSSKAVPQPIQDHKRGTVTEVNPKQRWTDHPGRINFIYIMDNDSFVLDDEYFLVNT